jgi:hypothetical protein
VGAKASRVLLCLKNELATPNLNRSGNKQETHLYHSNNYLD